MAKAEAPRGILVNVSVNEPVPAGANPNSTYIVSAPLIIASNVAYEPAVGVVEPR